jgi:hypothetical protein
MFAGSVFTLYEIRNDLSSATVHHMVGGAILSFLVNSKVFFMCVCVLVSSLMLAREHTGGPALTHHIPPHHCLELGVGQGHRCICCQVGVGRHRR